MNQKAAKKLRKEVRRNFKTFFQHVYKLPFRKRVKIAWQIVKGKPFKSKPRRKR